MDQSILITGGAGFIASHLADELLRAGYRVRALDALVPQVHGPRPARPEHLDPRVELLVGDVRDEAMLARALDGVEAVFHFAAAVGVGQSMYQVAHYTEVNDLGTARLMEALIRRKPRRLVVASSMAVYGEGAYRSADGQVARPVRRDPMRLAAGDWEPRDALGRVLEALPTSEHEAPEPASVYALGKYCQERMCLEVGAAYGIPVVALRFFNVYGPRQALSNPYSGVLAIFAARYLAGEAPLLYEDGLQRRDFVSVHDAARACRLALETPAAAGEVLNIGNGAPRTLLEVAALLAQALEVEGPAPRITGKHRAGDIRHGFADVARAREVLGFSAEIRLDQGLAELCDWLRGQEQRTDERGSALLARGAAR